MKQVLMLVSGIRQLLAAQDASALTLTHETKRGLRSERSILRILQPTNVWEAADFARLNETVL